MLNVLERPGLIESGRVRPLVLKPAPLTFACVMVRTALPVLPTRIVCELDEFTGVLPRFALVGIKVKFGWVPAPLMATTALEP